MATVSSGGKVTAVKAGTATITVTTEDGGKTATCAVTVKSRLPEGPLPGEFSVSATKKVQFSKGNLVATIDAAGTPTAWKFAANQYDYLGEGGANQTIGTAAGDVDFFGWSTTATKYGISTSTSSSDYSGDFVDWGKNIGDGSTWRTLSKDEWVYLFKTRTNATGLYKKGVKVCGKTNCVVIAPDGFTGTIETSYDATAWATAEAAGLVCLPAAGHRYGSFVNYVGADGYYWSSSAYGSNFACSVDFDSSYVSPGNYVSRLYGYSVRLITASIARAPDHGSFRFLQVLCAQTDRHQEDDGHRHDHDEQVMVLPWRGHSQDRDLDGRPHHPPQGACDIQGTERQITEPQIENNMKKILTILFTLALFMMPAQAQSLKEAGEAILGAAGASAGKSVINAIGAKTEKVVDKVVDKVIDKAFGDDKKEATEPKQTAASRIEAMGEAMGNVTANMASNLEKRLSASSEAPLRDFSEKNAARKEHNLTLTYDDWD